RRQNSIRAGWAMATRFSWEALMDQQQALERDVGDALVAGLAELAPEMAAPANPDSEAAKPAEDKPAEDTGARAASAPVVPAMSEEAFAAIVMDTLDTVGGWL